MPATAEIEVQGLLCPSLALSFLLLLSRWFSLPLFLISSKYLLKSQDVETPEGLGLGLMTWYSAHMSSAHKTRRRGNATTHTHAGFVLAVTQWQLEGGTNKNSSRCLHSPPQSCFHLVLSNLCSMLPSSFQPSSFIPNCLHPSTPLIFLSSHQIALAISRPHQQKSSYCSRIRSILAVPSAT